MKFKNGKKEFMIDCDNNQNVTLKVKTDTKKVIKVDGQKVETDEYVYDILGYFNSVEQCFNYFLNYTIKQKGRSENLINDVKSIIKAINEAKAEIKECVKNIEL